MRSRRMEGSGGGGIRIRSPPPSKARDHHRSHWHPNPYRKERFSPPLERQRLSRRALSSGEQRSASVERRGFPGHFDFDGGRDDSGVQIHSRPLDESFPFQESSHSDYRHRYFDVDTGENPNSKHVGVSSIGGGSSVGKAAKDKGFLGYGSSGFDGLTKNPLGFDVGTTRGFMLPSDPGYSSLGFNPSKIGGTSTYPSTSSSFGGNLNTSISEDHRIRFHDRLASSKLPTRETYEEEDKQGMMYSRDVSYPLLSSSSASQSKAFGPASGSLARDNLFSSYGDSLNLQSVGGFGGTSGKFMDSLDNDGHGVGRKLFDCPMNGPDMELKDVKPYRRSLLSPSRDEPHAYSFLELDERDRGGSRFLSDKPYKTMHPSARGNYSLRDPLGSTFTGRIRDRIDATDSSRGNQRETVGSLWDHQKDDPITSYHDMNRGMPLTVDRLGEPFNPGDTHLEFVTKVTRDQDFMHSGGDDYGYGRDVGSMAYRERLKSPPLSDHDPDIYKLDLDAQRRSNVEGLGVYDPSERTAKRKYVLDEMNGHDSRSAARSTSRHFQKQNGKDEHEKWVGKDRVGLFTSKWSGFERAPYRMPGKSYSGSHKVSSAWFPSKNVPLRMRAVGMQDASMKRRLRLGAPEFHGSFDKRHNFNRPHKFQKGSLDDRHGGANLQDEDKAPVVKTDPPQSSEEFKQQVQRAFLRFSKLLNENLAQQRRYREQGKAGSLLCFPCGSLSKEFVDTHSLVTHAFNFSKVGLKADHLGLHKALCVMMGWNSLMAPDNARAYQSIPAAEASALKEDLILWPPLIVIHNSSIGRKNAGEQVVITNERMEEILRGKFLEAKYPHLYWTPCAAHCLDLMLEDIFKIPNLKRTFERAIAVHGFIYNRPSLLNMMRQFTQMKELIKPAKTRFATAFLTLARIHQQKNNLRKLFTSEKWTTSKWAKEQQGKRAAHIMLMPSFWNNVVCALKVSGPLLCVLRLVDGEKKPPMGYIYEAISKAFGEKEERYKNIFEIIDRRWHVQLHRPLHAAGYFLNPEYFYGNPDIEQDNEVMEELYNCMSKLVPNIVVQDKISNELSIYTRAKNLFGLPMAIRQRATRAPEMGFRAGSKVCRGKPANHSILVVKFLPTFSGLQEAERLHKYYAENKRGRKEFQQIASDDCISSGKVREAPVGKAEELLLYGYMGIAEDLDKLDFETKKRSLVKSMKEIEAIADASLN